eukprot:Skav221148  [mRNA]  locus=scaffold2925:119238:120362:+ [translate_table: standard]
MEVASSVKKELVHGVKVKKERIGIAQPGNTPVARRRRLTRRDWPNTLQREVASSVKTERIDGAAWLQIRHRLEKVVAGANLKTPLKEEVLLANVREQVGKLIGQKKAGQGEDAVVASAGEPAAPPAQCPKPTQFRRNNLVKQSGVPQVNWRKSLVAWLVQFPRLDSKGKKIGWTSRVFSVKKFLVPGRTEAQADSAALEAAKAFRAELVQQGVLREHPDFTSEVPGVLWKKDRQKWEVLIPKKGTNGKKRIFGGCFTEKASAEAKALDLRDQHGLQRQMKSVSTLADLAELPVFSPKVPYPGVKWEQRWQKWRAQCKVGGANREFAVRPKDHSEEELERSFKEARDWKKKQEKEKKQQAAKPKVPVKKQCKNRK